ncbi:MAG: hypothetical protein M1825_005358 [Sarcosagium campestre]|nr:MAG: hypothetical protein M1825_005358 [Sarcosagium campestre]
MAATTPSPPSSPLEPPLAPLHGPRFDSQPSRPTRKSSRAAALQSQYGTRTLSDAASPIRGATSLSKRSSLNGSSTLTLSPPPSVHSSPMDLSRHDPSNTLPNNLGLGMAAESMLPTPAKTPRKRNALGTPSMDSTARVLFPARPETIDEAMPTPKKKRTHQGVGLSLGSFADDMDSGRDSERISIFTDSKERIPELDTSEDNPFYDPTHGAARNGEYIQPSLPKNDVAEETIRRDDGIIYVFRGKKIFRKFDDLDNEGGEDIDITGSDMLGRHTDAHFPAISRVSIKPRLLFPTAEQERVRSLRSHPNIDANTPQSLEAATSAADEEEEALTDIDDDDAAVHTPPAFAHESLSSMTSPPTANEPTQATSDYRPSDDFTDSPPPSHVTKTARQAAQKGRPFAAWQRRKKPADAAALGVDDDDDDNGNKLSGKREGESMEKNNGEGSKRTRSGTH